MWYKTYLVIASIIAVAGIGYSAVIGTSLAVLVCSLALNSWLAGVSIGMVYKQQITNVLEGELK